MAIETAGREFWVVGLARSGCAAGALLRRHGARVVGIDDNDEAAVRRRWEREGLSELAPEAFDEILTGGGWPQGRPQAVVISPGVRPDHPRLLTLPAGTEVMGELELACRFCRARLVAVTGTNGKSTVTEWTAHLLRGAGLRAEALGNVGRPLSLVADELQPADVAVVEVSSFQLETVAEFAPEVGTVLNLAPDHLDRYPDLQAYYRAKRILAERMPASGCFVTWTGCAEAAGWPTAARRLLFGDPAAGAEVFYRDGWLCAAGPEGDLRILLREDLSLQSPPNLLNAQAALALGLGLGLPAEALAPGLSDYAGLEHRHQLVGRLGAVDFIDDSKATNVHAVCSGLADYPRPVVLIAGGSGKGEDFAPLAAAMDAVIHAVVIGQEGPRIAAALQGVVPVSPAADLASAVALAHGIAADRPGAVVMLSPACASFDMFSDYKARGRAFAACALDLGAVAVQQGGRS